MNYKKILQKYFTLSLIFLSIQAFNQTGPGGVGAIDGSSHLKLWLRSDQDVQYNALDTVTSWTDYSGNSIAFDSTVGPTFSRNYTNGFPAIYFGQAISGLHVENVSMTDLFSAEENSIIIVKYSNTGTGTRTFFNWETAASNYVKLNLNSNLFEAYFPDNANFVQSSGSFTENLNIISNIIDVTNNELYLYLNSNLNASNLSHTGTPLSSGTADLYLGTADGSSTNGWLGYLTDLIIFDTIINSAQRTIIENALSAKYNITLTGTDYYDGNEASRDDFDIDVVGIGQESDGSQTSSNSQGFIITTSGSNWDDGDYVFAGHSNMENDATTDDCANLGGNSERWARSWYLDRIYTGDGIDVKISFDFSDGISGTPPASAADYRLIYRDINSGDFDVVDIIDSGIVNTDQIYFTVANANLDSGYYTLGTINKNNSPVTGGNTWFSYVDGDWDNWECWTLDPDGSLLINPTESSPGGSDTVYILNGNTISAAFDDISTSYLEIRSGGSLDLGTTTGHDFNSINGAGQIWIASNNFPGGDTSDFITRGTVKYYGTGTYNITTQTAYYNLEIEMDNSAETVIMMDSLTINNDLTITQGIFQINDNTDDVILTLTVLGNIDVQSNGKLTVGTGDPTASAGWEINGNNCVLPDVNSQGEYHKIFHQIYAYGDLTNNGEIKLTNQSQPDFDSFTATGAVSVYMKNASNNTMNLYDSTFLYNLIIDKGTDQTYILTIYSTDSTFFRLYGPNSVGRFTGGFQAPFDEADFEQRKALWIYHGTLKLTGNIFIPSLTEGENKTAYEQTNDATYDVYGDFSIGASGALWIAGNNVRVYTTAVAGDVPWGADGINDDDGTQSITITGRLKISAGNLNTRNSAGVIYFPGYAGELIIEGGTIDATQFRTSGRGTGRFTYIQTGGDFIVRGNTTIAITPVDIKNSEGIFNMAETETVFQMSGGNIYIYDNTTAASDLEINSDEGNYSVTGGKITISHEDGETFDISSTSNFWNLDIINYDGTGNFEVNLDDDLIISNDLFIDDYTTFDFDNGGDHSLYIGGNLTIGSTAGTNNANFGAGANTTLYFIGSGNSIITIANTGTANVFDPEYMVINKDVTSAYVQISSPGRTESAAALIDNDFTINKGIFDYGPFTIEVQGDLNNSGTMGTDTASGLILLTNSDAQQTITTAVAGNPTYGHIELNDANDAALVGNAFFNYFTLSLGVLNIGDYRLTVDTNIIDGSSFGTGTMIATNGGHGARGVKLRLDGSYDNTDLIDIPVGTIDGAIIDYANIELDFQATMTITGTINVTPVHKEHPAHRPPGGSLSYLTYYWKLEASDDLNGTTNIDLYFYNDTTYSGGNRREQYYNGTDWTSENAPALPGSPLSFTGSELITGEFTAGSNGIFNQPATVYSNGTGGGNWSGSGWNGGAAPNSYDFAIILDGDIVTMDGDDNDAASLTIYNGGVLDIGTTEDHDLIKVLGGGKIQINYNSGEIPNGDFDGFMLNDSATWEYYGANTYTMAGDFVNYPNLIVTGNGSNPKTFPNQDIVVQQNLYVDGEKLILDDNNDIEVYDSIIIDNAGVLEFQNNTGQTTVTVYKSIDLAPDGSTDANTIQVESGGAYSDHHSLIVEEDIIMNNNANITLFRNDDDKAIDLYFQGDSNSTITSSTSTDIDLNNLYIQKDLLSDTVTISSDFDLGDSTIDISSGTFIINNSNIDIYPSKNNVDFNIPTNGALIISNGTVNLSGSSSGITLNGKLGLENNSQLLMANSTDDNYIEYSSSGSSEINISDNAILTVGSQIRRNLITSAGMLNYTQTGGTVTVGNNSAPESSRGVLEVLNTGSNFTFSGGDLIIARGSSTSAASLYLDPASSSVSSGAYITFGKAGTTPNADEIGMFINCPVKNIRTINPDVTGPTDSTFEAKIYTVSPTLDTLNIAANTTFNCNSIQLFIEGDYINSGTFNGNNNTTKFTGTKQYLTSTGTSNFYNLSFFSTDTAFVNNDITINNNLTIGSGVVLSDEQNTIRLLGNFTNAGVHYSPNSSVGGVWLNGTSQQDLYGSGTYGSLDIDNAQGVQINSDFILVNNTLTFTNGNFYINEYSFTMGASSTIDVVGSFSKSKMIVTNGATSDKGVTKNLNSGSSTNILIPFGTINSYTPVTINSISSLSPGSITFKPISIAHPTADYPDIVLQYYWKLSHNNLTNISSSLQFKYVESDVSVARSNVESDYIPAFLEDASWAKYGTDDVNTTNNTIDFSFFSRSSIEGDYTCGIDTGIPDNVPVYVTTGTGDGTWEDPNSWQIEGGGAATSYPDGYIVKINHDLTISANLKSAYKTIIDTGVTLYIDSTIGHYLGTVSGYGGIRLKRGKLPAGNYENFFTCDGGSIEFGGLGIDYTIPDEGITYRRLIISGSGTRTLPDQDITICDTLIADGVTLDNNTYDNTITMNGWFDLQNSGQFRCGSGTVIYSGSSAQTLGGFTGNNGFYNFTVNNSNGITLDDDVDISKNLTLTNGVITTDGEIFTLEITGINYVSPDGGSSSSYINGPFYVELANGNSFDFPIGDDRYGKLSLNTVSTTGQQTWKGEYIDAVHSDLDVGTGLGAGEVSGTEYWQVTQVTGSSGTGTVQVRWDGQSDVNGVSANGVSNIRVARFNNSTTAWDAVGATGTGSAYSGTIPSDSAITFSGGMKEFTLASIGNLLASANFVSGDTTVCPGLSANILINLTGDANWYLEYSINGTSQTPISGITTSPYTLVTTTAGKYALDSVEENGAVPGTVNKTDTVQVFNYTGVTADAGTPPAALCEGEYTTLDATGSTGTGTLSYLWDNVTDLSDETDPQPIAQPASSTTYTVTVTDDDGCEDNDGVLVTVNPAPSLTAVSGDNPACTIEDSYYSTPLEAGSPTYIWSLNPAGTGAITNGTSRTPTINWTQIGNASTNVYIKVVETTTFGCSKADSLNVIIYRVPETGEQYCIPDTFNP